MKRRHRDEAERQTRNAGRDAGRGIRTQSRSFLPNALRLTGELGRRSSARVWTGGRRRCTNSIMACPTDRSTTCRAYSHADRRRNAYSTTREPEGGDDLRSISGSPTSLDARERDGDGREERARISCSERRGSTGNVRSVQEQGLEGRCIQGG